MIIADTGFWIALGNRKDQFHQTAMELREGRILSTDRRDFRAYCWKNQHPFHNLLFDQ